ncbi:hypothetical protein VMCG_03360 [Cytospora schulzeri]|uniref:Heterokaryon incompatibility domain-containing protein n=1 Tax=Cytospora schulzeri TaxID=448051 RepID=A0A423WW06_9PEZI|nr:hypothetical protein VMCG_03360 [Valsa malicola]
MPLPLHPESPDTPPSEKWRLILDMDMSTPKMHMVDIGPTATPGHLRLIDCIALLDHQKLKIWEFVESLEQGSWPRVPYAVVSYIWRGNRPAGQDVLSSNNSPGSLRIKGAEDADPISVKVLRTICQSSMLGVPPPAHYHPLNPLKWTNVPRSEFLWLDQLCISQENKSDKAMQITKMHDVYSRCTACFIVPGGMQRLVRLDEETEWTHRAWTLQECIAPPRTFVIFSWHSGERMGRLTDDVQNWTMSVLPIDSESAFADFKGISRACTFRPLRLGFWLQPGMFPSGDCVWTGTEISVRIFGKHDADLYALYKILEDKSSFVDRNIRHGLVWRCALTRTSSRPVDMVFSIMGLLGVQLNPRDFHKDDRLGATIALITRILENGGSADWLGIVPSVKPCPELSTFPVFPDTLVTGEVTVKSTPFRSQTNYWVYENYAHDDSKNHPFDRIHGRVDEAGYVLFRRKACCVVGAGPDEVDGSVKKLFKAEDGKIRMLREDLDVYTQPFPRTVVIPLWDFTEIVGGGSQDLTIMMKTEMVYMFMVLVGSRVTPVAFSFGWVAYAVTAVAAAVGDNKLMPVADCPCKVINGSTGFVRDNYSWVIGRMVRDFDSWKDEDNPEIRPVHTRLEEVLDSQWKKLKAKAKEEARETGEKLPKQPPERPPKAGLCVSIYRAKQARPGYPGYDRPYIIGFVTCIVQLGLSAVPCGIFGDWSIFLITAAGIVLSFASGALPQWSKEKWACRRDTRKTVVLTRGNGSQHAIVIIGDGKGLDLEDLAASDVSSFPSGQTRFCVITLAVLWVLLLVTASGIQQNTWFLLAIGAIGILQNVYVAGACRSPEAFGIPLEFVEVIAETKVMQTLFGVEERYPSLGRSMLGTFFPGHLREDEQVKWDSYAATAKTRSKGTR